MLTNREHLFFLTFPSFTPNPSACPLSEFTRLATQRHWKPGSKLWRRHWRACFGIDFQPHDISDDIADGGAPAGFFDAFTTSGFTPDPTASIAAEFARLAAHMGWGKQSREYREQRLRAYGAEFERHYGADASRLENWQRLCGEVGVEGVPGSITQCKKVRWTSHVPKAETRAEWML